eukprot:28767-Prorocentrum_minimum.AAC.3
MLVFDIHNMLPMDFESDPVSPLVRDACVLQERTIWVSFPILTTSAYRTRCLSKSTIITTSAWYIGDTCITDERAYGFKLKIHWEHAVDIAREHGVIGHITMLRVCFFANLLEVRISSRFDKSTTCFVFEPTALCRPRTGVQRGEHGRRLVVVLRPHHRRRGFAGEGCEQVLERSGQPPPPHHRARARLLRKTKKIGRVELFSGKAAY